MARIPQAFIDDLIARADIVEVIGSRVQLKKAGREWKACCPFHGEKTPSFWVSPEKGFYHCFGCGKHGTVIGFLMEHDRLSFPEAVEDLAQRLGVEVPRDPDAKNDVRRSDDSLYDLMSRVSRFYSEQIARDERVRQYVAKRGLNREAIDRFAIGYAPNSWNDVLRKFGEDEGSRRQLTELGLIIERERAHQAREGERHYDRFRDRLMFPIRDARGRTIAFGGRIIDQGEPKYLNSPETVLFHKGRELYGLYEIRQSRAPLRRLLIVEGYMDVVRLHQFGITYAAATLGTATTPEHLKRIFRLVSEVVFSFDGDRPGRAAAWRALQNALPEAREGREIKFLFLPEGHDPDTFVGEQGREAFEKLLDSALPLSEYLVRELSDQVDLSHADGRARFAENARPLIAKLQPGVYHELVLARVAAAIGMSAQRLQELWNPGAASQTQSAPVMRAQAVSRTRVSAGRRTVISQAIEWLVRFPAIASTVTDGERELLDMVELRGIEVLRELLDNLRAEPAQVAAQVIERWADRPEREHLERLLQREELVSDAAAASRELRAALVKLGDLKDVKRFEALQAKIAASGLDPDELKEYQRLSMKRPGGEARR
jgi:DNA primase